MRDDAQPLRGTREAAVARDLRIALRSRAELGVQLLFFAIVVSLFPLATSPERQLLQTLGPGVLWVAALLASLLSLPLAGLVRRLRLCASLSPWQLAAIGSTASGTHPLPGEFC